MSNGYLISILTVGNRCVIRQNRFVHHSLGDILWAASILIMLSLLVTNCRKSASSQPPDDIDTTSNVVSWRTDTIGVVNSEIHDIAIIDDNNIWAVGAIYLRDSSGNIDQTVYNLLRWDGNQWNPQRLYVNFNGTQYIRMGLAVFAFTANDIWISCDVPEHWDGQRLNNVDFGGTDIGEVHRMWGRSSNDLYTAGSNGKFSHYDGTSFRAVTTGVQSWFWDVFGIGDVVYLGSYNYDNQIEPSGVFVHDTKGFRFLFPNASDTTNFRALQNCFGVWASPQGTLWTVTPGFVYRPMVTHAAAYSVSANGSLRSLICIRGLSDSDVWAGGAGGLVVHYNGASWREHPTSSTIASLSKATLSYWEEHL